MARPQAGFQETIYRVFMKRNTIYIPCLLIGALVGERVVDYGLNSLWERNNAGKLWKDLEPRLAGGEN